eukprot:COSAG05_NODE_15894_length_358_cov_1.401544_1_plen_56_part_10
MLQEADDAVPSQTALEPNPLQLLPSSQEQQKKAGGSHARPRSSQPQQQPMAGNMKP